MVRRRTGGTEGQGPSRFRINASARGWRKGRFRLVSLPEEEAEDLVYARDSWGSCATSIGVPGAEHIELDLYREPYGLVARGLCTVCGGRTESFLDGRAEESAFLPGTPDELDVTDLDGQTVTPLAWIVDLWAPEHRDCPTRPVQHHIPGMAQEFADSVLAAVRSDIGRGLDFPGFVILLADDGGAMAWTLGDMPADDQERCMELARRKAAARGLLDEWGRDVVAAVVVHEVWITDAAGERGEALMVAVSTTGYGQVGLAPIERVGNSAGQGPGLVDDMEWYPLTSPSPVQDGLMAQARGG